MATTSEARIPRFRSLAGCATCRQRHMKCDERQPVCSVCQYYGLFCGGYKTRISFVGNLTNTSDVAPDRFRRPLFTESRRQRMSDQLLLSIRDSTIDSLLKDLDAETDHTAAPVSSQNVQKGPFGAFSSISSPNQNCHDISEQQNDLILSSPIATCDGHESNLYESSECISPFDDDTDDWLPNISRAQELLPDPVYNHSRFDLDNLIQTVLEPTDLSLLGAWPSDDDCSHFENEVLSWEAGTILPMPGLFARLPEDAAFLLSHYGNTVVGHLSPLKHPKSPWHLLQLPDSKTTFAAIVLGDDPGPAALCIFHGILAISAHTFRLSYSSQTYDHWKAKGDCFKSLSLQNLHGVLRDVASIPKKAKYKQVLTAVLTVITMLVYSGDERQARLYASRGEKLIRCRGLTKSKKSRKVRLLHHWYAYMRIFHESILLGRNSDNSSNQSKGETNQTRLSSGFRLTKPQTVPSQTQLQQIKGRERSENDLLLEEPGLWEMTMYPEIFGVPETWLLLLSLTVRLGNEGDFANHNREKSPISWQEYSTYAQSLEKSISDWKPPNAGDASISSQYFHQSILPTHRHILENMWKLLHTALRIYFYRRVYNVSPVILQQQVETIRTCLEQCEMEADDRLKYSAAFLWPAFIAAAEALDENTQDFFANWFNSAMQKSSFYTLWAAYGVVEEVRRRRKIESCHNVTWCDVVREKETCLFFC